MSALTWGLIIFLVWLAGLLWVSRNYWRNRWYDLGEQHAKALDQIAYLKDCVNYDPTRHGADSEVHPVPPGATTWVVQTGREGATGQPLPGMPQTSGQRPPGPPPGGGGGEGGAGVDRAVVEISGRPVRVVPPAADHDIPF